MNRRPSPRPDYDRPTAIPREAAALHLWGDQQAGHVADRIYVSSNDIHQLEITLPPGGAGFQHSDGNRTIFAADEVFYVIQGEMVIANPQTGQVEYLVPGEAAFFRRDTWHHAYSYGTEPLVVLEYFSPPPARGTSSPYAKKQPYLEEWSYTAEEPIGRWPMERDRIRAEADFTVIRDHDLLWRLENPAGQMLVGLLASTEHLTVGKGILLPGHSGHHGPHPADECLYVLSGTLNVFLPEVEGQTWFELHPGAGFYLPGGTPHEFHNMHGERAVFLFGAGPSDA
jgi:mannose-6-phosphate isomerase-like protein (cupin superfamily)